MNRDGRLIWEGRLFKFSTSAKWKSSNTTVGDRAAEDQKKKKNPLFQLQNKPSWIRPHEVLQFWLVNTVYYLLVKNNKGREDLKKRGGLIEDLRYYLVLSWSLDFFQWSLKKCDSVSIARKWEALLTFFRLAKTEKMSWTLQNSRICMGSFELNSTISASTYKVGQRLFCCLRAVEVGHCPKCIFVGVINQSHLRI